MLGEGFTVGNIPRPAYVVVVALCTLASNAPLPAALPLSLSDVCRLDCRRLSVVDSKPYC